MQATNTTATSAKAPETGAQSSMLDLGLDSIVLLKRQGKFSVKNIVLPSSFRGWLENSPSEGERWLRSSAQNGDLYAMEKLGLRLLTGDGLPKSPKLDEESSPNSSAEGERWLRNAVEHGHRLAMVDLGTRLITGNGLAPDPKQGEQLLHQAARQGSQIAMMKLGTYLLSCWGLNQNQEEGLRWLRRAGATTASQLLELGLQLYQKSLAATTKAARGLEYVSFCLTAHSAIIPLLFFRE